MRSACVFLVALVFTASTNTFANPSLVGYTVLGGGGIDEVATGMKSTYIATDRGDEIKLSTSISLISSFDKLTLLVCARPCASYKPSLLVLVKGKAHAAQLLVAGSGSSYGNPLSELDGYTVVLESEVSSVRSDRYGGKVVKLADGKALRISMLLLDPLFGTDVVVFARTFEVTDKKTGAPTTFTMFKLMFDGDDEVYDITP